MRLWVPCVIAFAAVAARAQPAEPAEPADTITAIQKRPLRQASRLEVSPYAEMGIADPYLQRHAAHCPTCRETLAVAAWMQELAGLTVMDARLPDPTYLWWKAELLRRWDAQQRAAAPIDLGERVQVGIALVGAVALLICLWRDASRLATSSSSPLSGSELGRCCRLRRL